MVGKDNFNSCYSFIQICSHMVISQIRFSNALSKLFIKVAVNPKTIPILIAQSSFVSNFETF